MYRFTNSPIQIAREDPPAIWYKHAVSMVTPNVPSSYPINDNTFFMVLMPNRGRTRFVRAAVLLFLAGGIFGWIAIAARVLSEFHARRSWPIAQGYVTDVHVKSFTGPSLRDHVSHYFVEYEVRFVVPAEQCLTGTTFLIDGQPPLCEGIARTRTTNSEALANSWFERHRFNEAVGVLHDPNGPGVKIVGEPAYLVYPWKEIFGMSLWMILFSTLLIITQRRLRYLETLPEHYDASPPSQSPPSRGDDLIDMNLC
jgi:hypothetical protein